MQPQESILFVWGKGAGTRRKILHLLKQCGKEEPCFLNRIAHELGISHVATRKHLTLLIEGGYVQPLNPDGKPVYLTLTEKGKRAAKKYRA